MKQWSFDARNINKGSFGHPQKRDIGEDLPGFRSDVRTAIDVYLCLQPRPWGRSQSTGRDVIPFKEGCYAYRKWQIRFLYGSA